MTTDPTKEAEDRLARWIGFGAGVPNDSDERQRLTDDIHTVLSTLAALASAARPFLPISVKENQDYAVVYFGEHQTQAMTLAPDDWLRLGAALRSAAGGV